MKTVLKLLLAVVLLLAILAAGGYAWASGASADLLSRTVETHRVDFPVPYSAAANAGEPGEAEPGDGAADPPDGAVDALAQAIERGEHLVHARYGCADCHGGNLGGGTMMDAMPMGRFLGPNLTLGEGGVTATYEPSDWDRAVRHGVGQDGRPLVMPAQEFKRMSDQELSDIVAYIRSLPPVDAEVTAVALGPIGKFLVARGIFGFAADGLSHDAPHVTMPPTTAADETFGAHLAATCTGCHKEDYTGGDIGGDPGWAPAANLTAAGPMADLGLEDFFRVMREGIRPDGTEVLEPMTFMLPAAQRMTDLELEAIYLFLRSLPAKETTD